MAGALIGALRVALGLDSTQFTTGSKKAKQEAAGLAGDLRKAFDGVSKYAAMAGAAVAAIGAGAALFGIKQTIDAMDDLSKAAQKVGSTTEELSKLRWAADLSGVSADTLQAGMNKLNRAIVGIVPGAKGAAGELARLGVTAGTGTLDAMMKVADQFARMPDGAQKSALAIQLFGKSGAELIPLLNGGAAGLKAAADEAERLGLVIDAKAARSAEAFNDNLTRLGKVKDGIINKIAQGMVPALEEMSAKLVGSAVQGDKWVALGARLGEVLNGVADAMLAIVTASERLPRAWRNLWGMDELATREGLITANMKAHEKLNQMMAGGTRLFNPRAIAEQENYIKRLENLLRAEEARNPTDAMTRLFPLNKDGTFGAPKPKVQPDLELPDSQPKTVKIKAEFVGATMREGWALDALLDRGTPAIVDINNQALRGIAATMKELKNQDFKMDVLLPEAFNTAARFAENLAQNLSQALVFGQSLGDALKASIRAAAAELITSGLMNFLLGGRNPITGQRGGGLIGGLFGIPGFADGTNYAPGGLAMVGERGRELVQLPRGSRVIPNSDTERLMAAKPQTGGQVQISLAPGLVATMVEGAVTVAKSQANEAVARLTRPRLAGAMGA